MSAPSTPLQSLHNLLASEAAAKSSALFVYDTTPTAPWEYTPTSHAGAESIATAEVFNMETRPGAGSALVGFVESIAYTSKGAEVNGGEEEVEEVEEVAVPAKRSANTRAAGTKKVKTSAATSKGDQAITVLSSTSAFLALVPSLLSLPAQGIRPPVTTHVSAQISSLLSDSEGEPTLVQIPDLAPLFEGVQALDDGGWNGAVVLSETAEEAAFVGTAVASAVATAHYDLVNVFDGLTAGRQLSSLEASASVKNIGPLSEILSSALPFFSYFGSASATAVLVLPASTYSASAKAALAATVGNDDVGVLVVRVVKPWSAPALIEALPASVKTLHLFAQGGESNGPFYENVLTALLTPTAPKIKVAALSVPSNLVPTVQDWAARIASISSVSLPADAPLKALLPAAAKLAVFWSLDSTSGQSELVPFHLAQAFAQGSTGVEAKVETTYDNFSQGGIQQSALLLEPAGQISNEFTVSALLATSPASLLFLSSPAAIFKAYEPLATIGADTRIVISANWTADEAATKLPVSAKQALATKVPAGTGNVFIVDADKLASTHKISTAEVSELVFWSLYLPAAISSKEIVALLANNPTFASWDHAKLVEINSAVRNAILSVEVPASWAHGDESSMEVDGESAPVTLPSTLTPTAAGPNADRTFPDPISRIDGSVKKSWHHVAQRLMYPEAFALESRYEERLRPDLPEKTYLVSVSETRRLTPDTYDRNVFHLEFDTTGTGLKYAVGEALGIHGWNDTAEVHAFLEWYGLDPEAVISVPSRDDPSGRVEQRTVFQVFQQNLDIFGKPGKSFYETLSKYATNKNEERALRFIACPEGNATFKKMSETDTVTYADILKQFPSAKPNIEDLVREIEEIKPRHYSIASSQNFVGDSVHLLIVTVEWQDPKGSPRFGQCTRYLAGLQAGDMVTVSVKPSVMKLPPSDTAPIIMAGLGTGAAPFRAFIQERAWQKAQGREIGPSLYYFGSRYRSKEYLYGEEIEAYVQEGIVTHTGLAFSRDTDKKVYIQHKMNEDAKLLSDSLKEGTFYLCGPTWPVPDVFLALVQAFKGEGMTEEQAEAHIEELKEEERYVLEVY